MSYPAPKLSDADVPNTYVNRNKNFQFNISITNSAFTQLSSHPCSEATITNRSGNPLFIFDGSQTGQTAYSLEQHRAMVLNANDSMTFRGITNSDQLTGKTSSGTGLVYVRTSFASNTTNF